MTTFMLEQRRECNNFILLAEFLIKLAICLRTPLFFLLTFIICFRRALVLQCQISSGVGSVSVTPEHQKETGSSAARQFICVPAAPSTDHSQQEAGGEHGQEETGQPDEGVQDQRLRRPGQLHHRSAAPCWEAWGKQRLQSNPFSSA